MSNVDYYNNLLEIYQTYADFKFTSLSLFNYDTTKFLFCKNLFITGLNGDIVERRLSSRSLTTIAMELNMPISSVKDKLKNTIHNFFDLYTSIADTDTLKEVSPISSVKYLYYTGHICSRAKNALLRAGFYNVNDLIVHYQSKGSLKGISNLGDKSCEDLLEILSMFIPCEKKKPKSKNMYSINEVADIIYNNYDKFDGLSKEEIITIIKESC